MSAWAEFCWWAVFLPVALWLQSLVPGLDALLVGVIILMQECRWKALGWLLVFAVLVQEGTGTLPFGASVLWYTATLLLFALGRNWFEGRNFPFVLMLSLALCPVSMGIMSMLTSLQHMRVDPHILLGRSIVQSLFLPVAWLLAMGLRRWGRTRVSA